MGGRGERCWSAMTGLQNVKGGEEPPLYAWFLVGKNSAKARVGDNDVYFLINVEFRHTNSVWNWKRASPIPFFVGSSTFSLHPFTCHFLCFTVYVWKRAFSFRYEDVSELIFILRRESDDTELMNSSICCVFVDNLLALRSPKYRSIFFFLFFGRVACSPSMITSIHPASPQA